MLANRKEQKKTTTFQSNQDLLKNKNEKKYNRA